MAFWCKILFGTTGGSQEHPNWIVVAPTWIDHSQLITLKPVRSQRKGPFEGVNRICQKKLVTLGGGTLGGMRVIP